MPRADRTVHRLKIDEIDAILRRAYAREVTIVLLLNEFGSIFYVEQRRQNKTINKQFEKSKIV